MASGKGCGNFGHKNIGNGTKDIDGNLYKVNKNTDNGAYYCYMDTREFFGRKLSDIIIRKSNRHIAISSSRRRNDLKGYIPYTHYKLDDLKSYIDNWEPATSSRKKDNKASEALAKVVLSKFDEFREFLRG